MKCRFKKQKNTRQTGIKFVIYRNTLTISFSNCILHLFFFFLTDWEYFASDCFGIKRQEACSSRVSNKKNATILFRFSPVRSNKITNKCYFMEKSTSNQRVLSLTNSTTSTSYLSLSTLAFVSLAYIYE